MYIKRSNVSRASLMKTLIAHFEAGDLDIVEDSSEEVAHYPPLLLDSGWYSKPKGGTFAVYLVDHQLIIVVRVKVRLQGKVSITLICEEVEDIEKFLVEINSNSQEEPA